MRGDAASPLKRQGLPGGQLLTGEAGGFTVGSPIGRPSAGVEMCILRPWTRCCTGSGRMFALNWPARFGPEMTGMNLSQPKWHQSLPWLSLERLMSLMK